MANVIVWFFLTKKNQQNPSLLNTITHTHNQHTLLYTQTHENTLQALYKNIKNKEEDEKYH